MSSVLRCCLIAILPILSVGQACADTTPKEQEFAPYFDFWGLSDKPLIHASDRAILQDSLLPPFFRRGRCQTADLLQSHPTSDPNFMDILNWAKQYPTADELENPWIMTKDWKTPGKVKIRQEIRGTRVYAKTKFDLPRPEDLSKDVITAKDWRAEELVRISLPVMDSLFVFGQFSSNGDAFNYQQVTAVAKTGFGWRWIPVPKSELQLRGGPMVTYLDTNQSSRVEERSQFTFEVLARMPIYGPMEIEYNGTAIPAVLPSDRDQINQDLRITLPISKAGEFHLGARYRWEISPAPTPWVDRTQLYFGVELKH